MLQGGDLQVANVKVGPYKSWTNIGLPGDVPLKLEQFKGANFLYKEVSQTLTGCALFLCVCIRTFHPLGRHLPSSVGDSDCYFISLSSEFKMPVLYAVFLATMIQFFITCDWYALSANCRVFNQKEEGGRTKFWHLERLYPINVKSVVGKRTSHFRYPLFLHDPTEQRMFILVPSSPKNLRWFWETTWNAPEEECCMEGDWKQTSSNMSLKRNKSQLPGVCGIHCFHLLPYWFVFLYICDSNNKPLKLYCDMALERRISWA
jgi:hypothetical protein